MDTVSSPSPRHVTDVDWKQWEPTDRAVLCFLRTETQILLIHKKRGLGKGKINGPGGRIDPGETALEAAIRETEEEVGLTPHDPVDIGTLSFLFADGYGIHVHVFFGRHWSGTLCETDEAAPFWCDIAKIPYDQMWADDRYWLPTALEGGRFTGQFLFDGDRMVDHALTVMR